MMKSLLALLLAVTLLTACGSKKEGADATQTAQNMTTVDGAQTGTSAGSVSGDVIGSDLGYIVENASIVTDPAAAVFSIKNTVLLGKGTTSVLVVRTKTEGGVTEFLALQFPSFADGTSLEYMAGEGNSGFWLFGVKGKKEIMKATGSVQGTIRLLKKAPSTATLGLDRALMDGTGEIEVVVTGINPEGLDVTTEKKYAARFNLPIISLTELAKLNQPI